MSFFTAEQWEADRDRYAAEMERLVQEDGLAEDHPLVERQRRRYETANRVLTDPAYGFAAEES